MINLYNESVGPVPQPGWQIRSDLRSQARAALQSGQGPDQPNDHALPLQINASGRGVVSNRLLWIYPWIRRRHCSTSGHGEPRGPAREQNDRKKWH